MKPGTVLLIAYHFPPDNAIGGARPYRFYKYLKRLGYECHVVTAARQDPGNTVPDIHYVPDPLRLRPRQGIAWQAERVGWKFLLRGELALGWSNAAWRAGRKFLNACKARHVTILSSAPPAGTHLAAWRLARHSGWPWIADFRDPLHSPAGEHAVLQGAIGPIIERNVLKAADLVLANTDAMHDTWASRYPDLGEKISVLWNGYDPEDIIEPLPLPPRARKILSHVGELYGGRNIRPVFDAAARLIQRGMLPRDGIGIRQIGAAEAADLPDAAALKNARDEGWFTVSKPVPAAEARAIALDSDGLLLIQPHTALQVPGKLFEYLRMGRPIFAYIVPDSPAQRILEQAGVPFTCIYPGQAAEEIENRLIEYIGKLDGRPAAASAWFRDHFEASRQIAALDRQIRSLSPK